MDTTDGYTKGFELPKDEPAKVREGKQKKPNQILLGYLNVGSNFNHLSAILSQQSILTFKALGSNTQIASLTKE